MLARHLHEKAIVQRIWCRRGSQVLRFNAIAFLLHENIIIHWHSIRFAVSVVFHCYLLTKIKLESTLYGNEGGVVCNWTYLCELLLFVLLTWFRFAWCWCWIVSAQVFEYCGFNKLTFSISNMSRKHKLLWYHIGCFWHWDTVYWKRCIFCSVAAAGSIHFSSWHLPKHALRVFYFSAFLVFSFRFTRLEFTIPTN